MKTARRPDDSPRVEITVEHLRHLLEVLVAGDVETAKMWLMAAIKQAKDEIRQKN